MEKFINKGNYFEYSTDSFIKIIFTNTQTGDMAFQGENKDYNMILSNRYKLAESLNVELNNFTFAKQNHTNNIYQVTKENKSKGTLSFDDGIENVDGLYTFENNIILSTFHADCTPVYIYSEKDNFISILHAGWQGTFKSITYNAISHYINELNISPENLKVIIGPSINKNHFEVEHDVLDILRKINYIDYESCFEKLNAVKYLVDIKKVNRLQAIAAGIPNNNIYCSELDTHSNDDFYSFRENKDKERMIACIMQKKGE